VAWFADAEVEPAYSMFLLALASPTSMAGLPDRAIRPGEAPAEAQTWCGVRGRVG
jgi:hypothetical protein